MKNKTFLFIFGFLFLLSILSGISASNNLTLSQNTTFGIDTGTKHGVTFNVTHSGVNTNMTQITKYHGSNASMGYLYLRTGFHAGNLLEAEAFVGDVATFNVQNAINSSFNYYALIDSNGSAYSYGINSSCTNYGSGINCYNNTNAPLFTNIDITAQNTTRLGSNEFFDQFEGILEITTSNATKTLSTSITSPTNNSYSNSSTQFLVANSTAGIYNLTNITYNASYSNHTVFNLTTVSITGNSSNITNLTVNGFTDGNYTLGATVCMGNGAGTNCTTSANITLVVDTTAPLVNITFPTNTTYTTTYTNNSTTFVSVNYTASDTNLNQCWIQINSSTNTTPVACNSANFSNVLNYSSYNFTVWANDSAGNYNSSFQSATWNFGLLDMNNYTFTTPIPESSSTTFTAEFTSGVNLTSSFLQYNNTNFSTSVNSLGSNIYILTTTLTTPVVSQNTNISWFFWVNNINATSQNQTVQDIKLDNCSSFGFKLVNYTLVDEDTEVAINNANSTIDYLVNLTSPSAQQVAILNGTITGNSTGSVCSQINLSTSGLMIWEQDRYGSTNYAFQVHNVQNGSITTQPINYTLRDLLSTEATTFRITFKSTTFLPVTNAVIDIQREYVGQGGIFKTVESAITDSSGAVSSVFNLNAVTYNIVISRNGTLLAIFQNPAITCANILTGSCEIDLQQQQSINLINTIDVTNDFNYGLNQNNRTIQLIFTIPDQVAKNVTLLVNQSTILGNKTSCFSSLIASSGEIDCLIDPTLGDVFTSISIYVNGNLLTLPSTATIFADRNQYFGTDNIVLTFFLVLSITLLMISSPITVLIGLVLGLVASSLMLFLNSGTLFGTASVITYVVIIVIVLIVKISMRERPY